MPSKIGKDEAIARLARFLPPGTCSMCHLIENDEPLAQSASAVLALNRFPLRWGHLLVVTRRHITSFEAIDAEEHREDGDENHAKTPSHHHFSTGGSPPVFDFHTLAASFPKHRSRYAFEIEFGSMAETAEKSRSRLLKNRPRTRIGSLQGEAGSQESRN